MSTSFAAISHMIKTASVVGLLAYHAMDPPCVGCIDQACFAQFALTLLRHLGQNVALARMVTLQLSRTGNSEALASAPIGFHFRHVPYLNGL